MDVGKLEHPFSLHRCNTMPNERSLADEWGVANLAGIVLLVGSPHSSKQPRTPINPAILLVR